MRPVPMRPVKPLFPLAILLLSIAACSGGGGDKLAANGSPGVRSTAYLPPMPNNAGTGTHEANTSLAVVSGQVPDASNPTPPGLPAASAALN